MTRPLPLTLKWRRSELGGEHYVAHDPERCKEAKVAYIVQQADSRGYPIDEWSWTMCAPANDYKTKGKAAAPRQAAYAAEQAYFRHMETVDPELFRLDLIRALHVVENARRSKRY